jgi:hypothetical protein
MKLQEKLGGFQRTKYKTIDFNGHQLQVYIPTRNEMQSLVEKIKRPSDPMIEAEYQDI